MADDQTRAQLVSNFYATPRIQWTPPLHERFLSAVTELGGPYEAKPKAILEKMGVVGLKLHHIKSHLQKYRITIGSARHTDDSRNSEQTENELIPATILSNAPVPQTISVAHDMRVYDVPGVQTTAQGILHAPYAIRGNELYGTETQGTSMAPAPYYVPGLGVYDVSVGTKEPPNMLQHSYDIRSQDDHALAQMPIETEVNPYLVSAPQTIGSSELYDMPVFQTTMEGITEQERHTNTFTDVRYINDEGNENGAFTSMMNYPNNTPLLTTQETTYNMGNQELYNQSTIPQGIEEGATQEESQYFGGGLRSGNNDKGKGLMGLPQHAIVTNHSDFPPYNMPSLNTMTTPNGMGGYEVYGGSSIPRETEIGVQQASQVCHYGGGLNSVNNNNVNGIVGLPPHDVVANHLDFPTYSMPPLNMMPTPYTMGGYEVRDGSSIQNEMGGLPQASQRTDAADVDMNAQTMATYDQFMNANQPSGRQA